MKTSYIVLFLICLFCTVSAFSQSSEKNMWSAGGGVEVGVPVGDFNNVSSVGFGVMGTVGYMVDPNFTVTGKIGFLSFSGKDAASGSSATVIPILVGGRYYFMPPSDMRVYGAVDLGLYNINNGVGTKFGFSPALGAMFKAGDNMNVDAHINYTTISTDVITTSWVGVGVGLMFDLK